jgi:hypothetical protein
MVAFVRFPSPKSIWSFVVQVIASVVGAGVLVLVVAAAVALAAFGTETVTVEGWLVVLFAVVLIGLVAGETLLAKGLRNLKPAATPSVETSAAPRPPNRHASLINRIDALDRQLAEMQGDASARQAVGSTYNGLLAESRAAIATGVTDSIQVAHFRNPKWADVDNSQIRVWLGQLRVLLTEDGERVRRADATISM